MLLTALLAGDIEINPGPGRRGPKYPRQICSKAAKWGQKAIECDQCSSWFHAACLDMNDHIYSTLAEHQSYSRTCCNCGLPNLSTTFFASFGGLDLTNSFSALDQLLDSFIGDTTTTTLVITTWLSSVLCSDQK